MPIHVCVEGVLHIVKVGATRLFQLAQGSPFFLSCPYCSNSLLIVICTVVTITVFLAAVRTSPLEYTRTSTSTSTGSPFLYVCVYCKAEKRNWALPVIEWHAIRGGNE